MHKEKNYRFKFSIIMAVYNVELFLEEAIESVLNQDIGFRENVQLLLINDGSKDHSGEICDRYQKQYPENIVVVHKENGGVSLARNEGLKRIEGEYVNCLDSDDKLSENTLRVVYEALKRWDDEVDLAAIPLRFFDGKKGDHILNYKFDEGTRIIDLQEEYDKPQLSMSCAFIKNSVVSKYRFDENLAYAEDGKIVLQVLQEKMKYGVVAEACYWYRKRTAGSASAVQNSLNNKKWYLDYLKHFSYWTIQNSKAKNEGQVPLFVQYTVMYDLQWRFNSEQSPALVMNEQECEEYFSTLHKIMKEIEDPIVLAQKNMGREYKLYALEVKYGSSPRKKKVEKDMEYCFGAAPGFTESEFLTKIEFLKFHDGMLEIEGLMVFPGEEDPTVEICVSKNGKIHPCKMVSREVSSVSMGNVIGHGKGFQVSLPVSGEKNCEIRFGCRIDGHYVERQSLRFGKFSPLQNQMWNSYYAEKPYLLTYRKNALYVKPYSFGKHLYRELSFLKGLAKIKDKAATKAIMMRILYHLHQLVPHKEVWLISDRINKADDNGEAFFEYLNEKKPKDIEYYYAISSKSPDFARLKKKGNVIEFLGWKYKWLCLCGAKVISSQGEDYIYRPFRNYSYCYADLMQKTRFVFLQHGVIKDDLSRWLKRYHKNIHMFVTTTVPEYESIIQGDYSYDESVVKMTGLPRHDRLYHKEKNYITIMPSWRAYLVGETNVNTGKRQPSDHFEDSRYCQMYSELLGSAELLDYVEKKGYKIRFMPHPNMSECTGMMKMDPRVQIVEGEKTAYRDIFAESNLVVTDYSSVVFDFAYLRKPVLYFQADQEEFFSGSHTYDKGYFEYERDGFGEVAYDTAELIGLIKDYISRDCALKEQYAKRINATFPYADQGNSERVYTDICRIR